MCPAFSCYMTKTLAQRLQVNNIKSNLSCTETGIQHVYVDFSKYKVNKGKICDTTSEN